LVRRQNIPRRQREQEKTVESKAISADGTGERGKGGEKGIRGNVTGHCCTDHWGPQPRKRHPGKIEGGKAVWDKPKESVAVGNGVKTIAGTSEKKASGSRSSGFLSMEKGKSLVWGGRQVVIFR